MAKKESKPNIDANTIFKLDTLFYEKGWDIEDKLDNQNSLYNNFAKLFSWLNKEEQDFIYEITRHYFLKINIESYPNILRSLFAELIDDLKNNDIHIKSIYIAPLMEKKDFQKIKSSLVVTYLFKSVELVYDLINYKVNVLNNIKAIRHNIRKINENDKAILLIVDDFIGSGDTTLSCLKYIEDNFEIKKSKIIILSIAAQQTGIDTIQSFGYRCIAYHVLSKGITDNYDDIKTKQYLKMMEDIGVRLKVSEDNLLGFKKSESLISLIRTPNNTFPIFWLDKKNHGFNSPFPRSRY